MKRKNLARNALFTSVLSLLLCVSMLVGTTFAWFTDEVVSGTNVIAAGNLDVELYHGKGANPVDKVKNDTLLFTDAGGNVIDLWEPGVVAFTNLKVANVGTLALKYQLSINSTETNYVEYADGTRYTLADALKVAVVEGGVSGTREQVIGAVEGNAWTKLESFTLSGVLEADKKSETYGIIIYWQPGDNVTDNLFNMNNGKTTNDKQPLTITLGVNLFATQEMYEDDSFGPDYDGLVWDDALKAMSEEDLVAALANGATKIMLGENISLTNALVIPEGATLALNLNGKTINTAYAEGSTTNHVYAFTNNGNLLLKNGTVNARGIFNYGDMIIENATINAIDGNGGYAIRNYSGSTLTMNSGTIATTLEDDHLSDAGGYDATTLRVDAGASAVINGGTIENICDFTSAIENYGTVEVNDAKITAIHTAVYNKGTMTFNGGSVSCGMNGTTRHTIYDLGGKVTINRGTFINTATDQNATGASVINGNVEVNGGTFSGRIENYYGTPVIKGGTFSVEPKANFVAPGYQVTNNGDGTYTVGAQKVSTGAELVDAIANGKAVELTQDVSLGKIDLTDAITNDVVIDANGHKITTTESYGIEVTAGKNVTISNADVEMTKAGDYITYAAGFKIANGDYAGATITLKNCTITMANTDWAYAVTLPASVKNLNLVIDNCTLEGAVAVQCWGDNNTITITNSKLICNYTTSAQYTSYCVVLQDDGTYKAENNTLVIDNCEFLYSGIDNFNSKIYSVQDRGEGATGNTVTVTNCTYGEKVVA